MNENVKKVKKVDIYLISIITKEKKLKLRIIINISGVC